VYELHPPLQVNEASQPPAQEKSILTKAKEKVEKFFKG
jgi:hypothetical protein